jgi:hypothetical protein
MPPRANCRTQATSAVFSPSGAKLICDESVNLPDQFYLYMTRDGSVGGGVADPAQQKNLESFKSSS